MKVYQVIVLFVASILALLALGYVGDSRGCRERWQGSYRARYGFSSGCVVETSPGHWVPESAIHDVTIER